MKIAFCNRKNYDNPLGGDGVQMHKTKYYLEQLYKVDILILTCPDDLDESFDIVHIFNYLTINDTRPYFEKATSLNLDIISSSIYWDYKFSATHIFSKLFGTPDFISEKRISFQLKIINILAFFTNRPIGVSPKLRKHCLYFINSSKYILPNSIEEGNKLLQFCGDKDGKNQDKIRVIYNATDFNNENLQYDSYKNEAEFLLKYKIPSNYILQVGRIEYIKNQLNLLYALKDYPQIPIVFVGKVLEKKYYEKLKKIADKRGNVFFIPNIEHIDIKYFYKYAKVHVLLSLRESPGLVSLEAISMNCPIVVSDERFAPINTYFKNKAYITNPFDLNDILKNVMKANDDEKVKFEKNDFTWVKAAEQTYNVYLECTNKK